MSFLQIFLPKEEFVIISALEGEVFYGLLKMLLEITELILTDMVS